MHDNLATARVVWILGGALITGCGTAAPPTGPVRGSGTEAPGASSAGNMGAPILPGNAPSSTAPNPNTPSSNTGAAGASIEEGGPSGVVPLAGDPRNPAAPGGAGGATPEPTNCIIPIPSAVPIGYGAATTGGGSATPVIVSSFDAAVAALADYRAAFKAGTANALVIRYTGSFDYSSITDVCAQHTKAAQTLELKEMQNVTFEGASGSSANFGIHVNRAKNVIVRNMTIGLLPGGGDADALTIEGNGTNGDVENVWIDHNELFSSTKDDCDGAGDTEFDGLIDIKKGARRITVSYNRLHDHQKTGLLGFSDSDDTERYVTFHHNWYENVVSRTPLQRFGYTHIFNNYYDHVTSSGINVRMGGVALIESNFFENAANPVTSRYSDGVGYWDLRANYVGDGISWTTESDTLANAEDWTSTQTFPASELDYAYTPDDAACVKHIVTASAGAVL
jgi:pectate lyase